MSTMPIYALVDTWNSAGTVFTGIGLNVTDTASNAASLLLDLQVGGTSQFKVSKGGVVSIISTLELGHASDTTLARASAGVVTIEGNTVYTSGNLPGTALTWTAAQTFANNVRVDSSAETVYFEARSYSDVAKGGYFGGFNDGAFVDGRGTGTPQVVLRTNGTNRLLLTPTDLTFNSNTVYHAGNLPGTAITWTANQTLSDVNIVLGTTTGTKIGTAANQKLGFFDATPVVQPTAVADATDAASVITQLNALLTRMRNLGLIAT